MMKLEQQYSWIHKDKEFSIEVKCWKSVDRFVWNIYVYIYESYSKFNDKDWLKEMPLHGGCTYDALLTTEPLEGIRFDWQKIYKTAKIGCDYGHIYDSYFENHDPVNGIPFKINNDVEELIDLLISR